MNFSPDYSLKPLSCLYSFTRPLGVSLVPFFRLTEF